MNWKKSSLKFAHAHFQATKTAAEHSIYIFFFAGFSLFFLESWATCNKWREPYARRLARTVLGGVPAERSAPTRLEAQKN